MPQGRGNSVIFGRITLASEIESMDNLVKHLGNVIKQYGYPLESGPRKDDPKEQDELRKAQQHLKEVMGNGGEDR